MWLSPEESFKQFLPGAFAELVDTPDIVELQRIVRMPAPIRDLSGPPRYTATFKKRVDGTTRWRVLSLLADPKAAGGLNHARCAPEQCEPEPKLCGGFQPTVGVVLEKGRLRVRILVCFGCAEVRYERYEAGKFVGVEKGEINRDRWWATIGVLLPTGE